MTRLNPFDLEASCPKCGSADIRARYCTSKLIEGFCMGIEETEGEHMDRKCRDCKFEWIEATLDAEP